MTPTTILTARLSRSRITVLGLASVAAMIAQIDSVQASNSPRIESVNGSKTVLLQNGIELREAAAGEEIHVGERVRTEAKITVIVVYPDGSHLTVLPNSDLEIQKPDGKIQSNELRAGLVKGEVNKEPDLPGQTKKIHFVIRTRTAVMGVRGTEFYASMDPSSGLSQFHTMQGTVEVASNPTSLMGGAGTPVSGGQFVTATPSGISQAEAFNPADYLRNVSTGAANPTGGLSSLLGSALSSAESSAAGRLTGGSSQSSSQPAPPAPRLPEPPKPPEPPLAVLEEKAKEAEKDRPTYHLLAVALGVFVTENPLRPHGDTPNSSPNNCPNNNCGNNNNNGVLPEPQFYRSISIHWTPSFPLPFATFLVLRGSFGADIFQNGSLNNSFLIHDYQAFLALTLLRPLYVEVGGGEQIWNGQSLDGGVMSANAGLILSEGGRFNRLFVGVSDFKAANHATQVRAGIGFQF